MISEHKESFGSWPVVDWKPGQDLPKVGEVLPRLALSYNDKEKWSDLLAAFLETPGSEQAVGLVVGAWAPEMFESQGDTTIESLVAASERLPHLKALFIGDITGEEWEISWIEQSDLSPLFNAFPNLEWFGARGGNNLSLGVPRHEKLKGLVIETGGLSREIVRSISQAQLPALEHLELWLGDDNYGADTEIEDLKPFLNGDLFPNLKYLGLRNTQIADEIAQALIGAPVLGKVRVLDLSLGVLTDTGAQALLDNPAIAKLEKLDVHHHFCSEEITTKLEALPLEVDVSEREEADEYGDEIYRYVAHGE